MFRVITIVALAALAAAQSPEIQSNDGSINIETREGETIRQSCTAQVPHLQSSV